MRTHRVDARDLLISVMEIVEMLGIDGQVIERKNEFRFLCPSHDDRRPSCEVNLITGKWNCWACDAGGDIVGLVATVSQVSRSQAAKMLEPDDPSGRLAIIRNRLRRSQRVVEGIHSKSKSERTSGLDVPAPEQYEPEPLHELRVRGFFNHTLRKWGVRFAPVAVITTPEGRTFSLKNSIAIPIHDEDNRLLSWSYRSTQGSERWQPRYVETPGFDKNDHWFGINHHPRAPHIVVVEGPLDAMWLDQHGIPGLAMMGSQSLGFRKIERLADYPRVTIFPDRDKAGIIALRKIGERLHRRGVSVRIARYHSTTGAASDAQELCGLDIELAIERAVPWLTFLHRL